MLLDLAVGSMLIVLCPTVCAGPQSLMQRLFTKPPPNVRSVGKESGGRGRGRGGRTVGPVRYLPVPTAQEPVHMLLSRRLRQVTAERPSQ